MWSFPREARFAELTLKSLFPLPEAAQVGFRKLGEIFVHCSNIVGHCVSSCFLQRITDRRPRLQRILHVLQHEGRDLAPFIETVP